jgi:DMSO/TMAO reductase YedYZ molybdopterin-dependent catalytic subunit
MADRFISRGFVGKRRESDVANRVPPGQYLTRDFPVLSAGPTPRTPLDRWTFSIQGLVREPITWTWAEFVQLPTQTFVVDIHCVTKWSKLDTRWEGVSLDTLFEHVELDRAALYLTAHCDGGYTTNMPLVDVINGQAFVAYKYNDQSLAPEHGGPAPSTSCGPSSRRCPGSSSCRPSPRATGASSRSRCSPRWAST